MSDAATHYADMLRLNDGALKGLCREVGEDEARRAPAGRSTFHWLVGHLAEHRAVPLALLGGDRASDLPLTALFARDTKPTAAVDGADVAGPTVRELAAEFLRFGDLLRARVAASGDAAFAPTYATPAGQKLPLPHFFLFHETYHLGQLGLLRTWLGKGPLVPPRA